MDTVVFTGDFCFDLVAIRPGFDEDIPLAALLYFAGEIRREQMIEQIENCKNPLNINIVGDQNGTK